MPLDLPHCAPTVAPYTMEQVIRVENGSPFALHVNGLPATSQPHAQSKNEAVQIAEFWIAHGYSVDLGWTQTNSRNLAGMGLTVSMVLGDDQASSCMNVGAGGAILTRFYDRAAQQFGPGQVALAHALSAYNTGDIQSRGFVNGYVAKYYGVPAMQVMQPYAPRLLAAVARRRGSDTDVWN